MPVPEPQRLPQTFRPVAAGVEALPNSTSGEATQSSGSPSASAPSPSTPSTNGSSQQTSPPSAGSAARSGGPQVDLQDPVKLKEVPRVRKLYKCAICRSPTCPSRKNKKRALCRFFDPKNPEHSKKGWTNKFPELLVAPSVPKVSSAVPASAPVVPSIAAPSVPPAPL
jgi:hypothetical protein